ncbi:hypothetical protein [Actinomadura madurae]|nr:hypothetical protein [Actinomadura madurae]MCP9976656.1 hypothetical protein [Actinomadura madurae]
MALTMGGTVAYYTCTTYLTKHLSSTAGLSRETASLVSFCSLVVFMLLQPPSAPCRTASAAARC